MAGNRMIYVRKADEHLWELAEEKAGTEGISKYLSRLVRKDVLNLGGPGMTPDQKLLQGLDLIREVREEMLES
jgi:hypothetical protein